MSRRKHHAAGPYRRASGARAADPHAQPHTGASGTAPGSAFAVNFAGGAGDWEPPQTGGTCGWEHARSAALRIERARMHTARPAAGDAAGGTNSEERGAQNTLYGAHSSASTRGERDRARQTACSRPPPPMTRTFMGFNLLFNLWLRQRKGGRSSVRPPGKISA